MDIEQIIKVLQADYENMRDNGPQYHMLTEQFLKGYNACISDLRILANKTEVEKAKID